jgi:hypothetical protein
MYTQVEEIVCPQVSAHKLTLLLTDRRLEAQFVSRKPYLTDTGVTSRAMTAQHSYTLTEAAAVTGRSRVTMRRHLDAGKFPNAWRDESSGETPAPWRVPLGDLVAAGLDVHPADRVVRGAASTATQGRTGAVSLDVENSRLREELGVAVALADERARTIELLSEQVVHLRSMLADTLATIRDITSSVEV